MIKTPKSLRLHIATFGRTNVGKSSFLNMITGQDAAITSSVAGTTTDIVEKPMEILPLGPVVLIDTAGLDDKSALSAKRLEKTKKVFDRAEVINLLIEAGKWTDYEEKVLTLAKEKKIPVIAVINKIDISLPSESFIKKMQNKTSAIMLCSSIDAKKRDEYVYAYKEHLIKFCPDDFLSPPALVSDLVRAGDIIICIVPIDLQAPKGRLILPQAQTIRETLDSDAAVMVVKEREYGYILSQLKKPPSLVICDSQVVLKMTADTPDNIKCTTFSILFTRYKGDLIEAVKGALVIDTLKDGDKVLIAESCSHHAIADDIGRVKIPRWLRQYTGCNLQIDSCAGLDFPNNLADYKLVVQCGGCMTNRREILSRLETAKRNGAAITNYGVCISHIQGVLKRALSPFPYALDIYKKDKINDNRK